MIKLTRAQKEKYLKNEDMNYHTENIVLLAKISWKEDLLERAEEIKKAHYADGYLSSENDKKRRVLEMELWELIDSKF